MILKHISDNCLLKIIFKPHFIDANNNDFIINSLYNISMHNIKKRVHTFHSNRLISIIKCYSCLFVILHEIILFSKYVNLFKFKLNNESSEYIYFFQCILPNSTDVCFLYFSPSMFNFSILCFCLKHEMKFTLNTDIFSR